MHHDLKMLRSTLRNPFVQSRVDTPWAAVPADVASINEDAFQTILHSIKDVRESQSAHAVLLSGEPGSGKTHLLNRLRRWVQKDEHAWFVYIQPVTAPDRFHRHVLQALVSDVTRVSEETGQSSQLAIVVARHFMSNIVAPVAEIASWWQRVREEYRDPEALSTYLQTYLGELVAPLELSASVTRVIAQFLAGARRADARDWLLGRSLPEERLATLGVSLTLDEEHEALAAITTFVRLASEMCTVIFAFDQIEGLQFRDGDHAALDGFGSGVNDLLANHKNVAVITCAQSSFRNRLQDDMTKSYFDRVAEREAKLRLLNDAEAMELTRDRLHRDENVQSVRVYMKGKRNEDTVDEVWPLLTNEIRTLAVPAIAARRLIMRARDMFDEWLQRRDSASEDRAATYGELLERATEGERNAPLEKIDEGVYIDGLLKTIELTPGATVDRARDMDIDLEIRSNGQVTPVAIINGENMTSVAGRLRRLRARADALPNLRIIRDARLPLKRTARATHEHLHALQQAGTRFIQPNAEVYAALAAIRRLLASAAAGDLTVDGDNVAVGVLKEWLADHMPLSVTELVRDLQSKVGGADTDTDDLNLRIQEYLQGRWVVEAKELATGMRVSKDRLQELAATSPVFAVVPGDPSVVFLRSTAMERV